MPQIAQKVKSGGVEVHAPGPGYTCSARCVAARASQRLYGDPSHLIGEGQMEKQRRLDAVVRDSRYYSLPSDMVMPAASTVMEPKTLGFDQGSQFGAQVRGYLDFLGGLPPPIANLAPPRLLTPDDIDRRFGPFRSTGRKRIDKRALGLDFREFARDLNRVLPPGREAALAFTALEEAAMWAQRAINNRKDG